MSNTDWVTKFIDDILSGKYDEPVVQIGIDHLKDKKLYKYYSFTSEHTIENLKNGTIYLQNPVQFNDPFDCNIGISANQLLHMFMRDFFDKLLPNTDRTIKTIIESWFFGDNNNEADEKAIRKLLSSYESCPELIAIVNKAKIQNLTVEEIAADLIRTPDSLLKIIELFFNGNKEILDSSAVQHFSKLPVMISELAKMLSDGKNEQQIIKITTAQGDFWEKIQYTARLMGTDIPTFAIKIVYQIFDDMIMQIRDSMAEHMGVACFTQSPTDILMWSYYADKHKGICVEYDFSQSFSTLSNALLLPVIYSENRPLLDIQKIFDPYRKEVYEDKIPEQLPNIIKSFITKSGEWEREKEWRLIQLSIQSDSERVVPLPIMSRIITGINISDDDYKAVAEIAKEKGIPVHRTRLKNDQYKIEIVQE